MSISFFPRDKKHILSFVDVADEDTPILHELLSIIRKVAAQVTEEYGACKIMTNLGEYQESKHLHWHIVYGDRIRD